MRPVDQIAGRTWGAPPCRMLLALPAAAALPRLSGGDASGSFEASPLDATTEVRSSSPCAAWNPPLNPARCSPPSPPTSGRTFGRTDGPPLGFRFTWITEPARPTSSFRERSPPTRGDPGWTGSFREPDSSLGTSGPSPSSLAGRIAPASAAAVDPAAARPGAPFWPRTRARPDGQNRGCGLSSG